MNQHRCGQSLAGFRDESHGLANGRNRRNLLTSSMDESQHSAISVRSRKVSAGAAAAKANGGSAGMDDLLTSDGGKHDYDWLLTPPDTPLGENQATLLAPTTRSTSTIKSSRMSSSQSGAGIPTKPTRNTSATRPSIASSYLSSQASKLALNSSSLSVNFRPSTPTHRSPATSQSRPSTPSRTKTSVCSRPVTPTSRPQIPAAAKPAPIKPTVPPVSRATPRPSTPTRRVPIEAPVPSSSLTVRSPAIRTSSNAVASHARSPSPGPHTRQTIMLPDFPTETPPNLRTIAPERPSSVARSRPSSSHGTRSTETSRKEGATVRHPSPARGREHFTRDHVLANGHSSHRPENNQSSRIPSPRPLSSTADNGGFGRTISKKSKDVAMDVRHSTGKIHPLSGSSLFPQSIRPTTFKIRPASPPDIKVSGRNSNVKILENSHAEKFADHSNNKERSHFLGLITERLRGRLKEAEILRETDISISTRYDSFLLKEDLKNTEWLHSLEDESLIFDQRFEQLPEPFSFT